MLKIYALLMTVAFALVLAANIIDGRTIERQQQIIDTREFCIPWCEEQWADYGC